MPMTLTSGRFPSATPSQCASNQKSRVDQKGRAGGPWFSRLLSLGLVALALSVTAAPSAQGYTKESPEVRAMVDKGMKYLEKSQEKRLGAQCLIGLVFHKEGKDDHRLVAEAVAACQKAAKNGDADDVYANGIAIIFLSELDAKKHRNLIQFFLNSMARRQKKHGGWGYQHRSAGDTSQSQYGFLSMWEAFQQGIPVPAASNARGVNWLMNTQDPSGAWGYQGELARNGKLAKQGEITCSMVAAAMGSLLISADLVGFLQPGAADTEENPLPTGVTITSDRNEKIPRLSAAGIDRKRLLATIQRGNAWMDKNYTVSISRYTSYYLYAIERYKSLQAILEGDTDPEPAWYNKGVKYLMETQSATGDWTTGCGSECDTAFSILFLIRSMGSALEDLGDGTAVAGRGLPANIKNLTVRGGQVVVTQAKTEVTQFLDLLDDEKIGDLDALINDSEALVVGTVDEKTVRRLKQLVRSGEPAARILATRALARTGDFAHVPTLLYAFADRDPRLVQEARDGLRFVSRRFEGFGLKKKFTEAEQFEALDKWKKWYHSVRPDMPIVLE